MAKSCLDALGLGLAAEIEAASASVTLAEEVGAGILLQVEKLMVATGKLGSNSQNRRQNR
jgi:hypothetical protein